MDIQLGINNCFAVKRWPEPHHWAALIAEELSISQVQFSLDLIDLGMPIPELVRKAKAIRRSCSEAGISIHSVFTGLSAYQSNLMMSHEESDREYWKQWYEKAAWFTGELECSILGGHVGALSIADFANDTKKDEIIQSFLQKMQTITEFAKAVGIENFVLECMPVYRELTATIHHAQYMIAKVNESASIPVFLCLDTGHQCAVNNEGPERLFETWYQRLSSWVSMIHLQQNDGLSDQHRPFQVSENEQGVVRAEKILELIHRKQPALFLEVIPAHEADDKKVLDSLKESVLYWQKASAIYR